MQSSSVVTYNLSPREISEIHSLIDELDAAGNDAAADTLHDTAWSLSPRLPYRLREHLASFRRDETGSACIIHGFPIDDAALGSTPPTLSAARAARSGEREAFLISLVAMCVGDAFSWSTLQDGRLVHDVMPVRGEETAQSGHGSETLLEWHNEDAFHPFRADYLLLMGLRNPDNTPTILASIRDADVTPADLSTLAAPRFYIVPDDEHINQLAAKSPHHPELLAMRDMKANPRLVPVLFGQLTAPYVRIDPVYMSCREGDTTAAAALRRLIEALELARQDVVINAGDVLIIDNYLAVHGRQPFQPRYDGQDRWLKKALVTRDLRKSRSARSRAASRVIGA